MRLVGFRGRNVVIVFYPFAFSGICTGELCEIRDNLALFEDADAAVLAVSVDNKFAERANAEKEGYGFDLLADFWPHGAVASRLRGVRRRKRDGAARHVYHRRGGNRPLRRRQSPRSGPGPAEYRAALAGLGGTDPVRQRRPGIGMTGFASLPPVTPPRAPPAPAERA